MSDYAYGRIAARRSGGCRYIEGDTSGENWDYCGAPRHRDHNGVAHRMPYCTEHYVKCVAPAYARRVRLPKPEKVSTPSKYDSAYILDEEAA